MSLRARLLGVLLALTALGLLALAAITYAEQRSFLMQRVDDQTRAAIPALEHHFGPNRDRDIGAPPPGGVPGPPPGAGEGSGDRPGGPELNLPPGTYGQRRSASGKVTATTV